MKRVSDLTPEEARAWMDQPASEADLVRRQKAWEKAQFLLLFLPVSNEEITVKEKETEPD